MFFVHAQLAYLVASLVLLSLCSLRVWTSIITIWTRYAKLFLWYALLWPYGLLCFIPFVFLSTKNVEPHLNCHGDVGWHGSCPVVLFKKLTCVYRSK